MRLIHHLPLRRALALAVFAASLVIAPHAHAQDARAAASAADTAGALSLEEALRLAGLESETVRIAEAGVLRSRGEQIRARSGMLPQIYGSFGYTRTLKSQFSGLSSGDEAPPPGPTPPPGPCDQYLAPGGTTEERLAGLEQAQRCAAGFNPFAAFENLPFGQANEYQLGVQLTQPLFSGGRLMAASRAAEAGRQAAEIGLTSAQAQVILDVATAYYDAVLADRLFVIAQSSLAQTEDAVRQTTLARQVGNTSEFELLRAQVTRDNQRPVVIERRTQRDLAYLRLKQLLGMPGSAAIRLTTDIMDPAPIPGVRAASLESEIDGRAPITGDDTSAMKRATVRQAEAALEAQEQALTIARSQRLPSLNFTSQYGRVGYPRSGLPKWNDFLSNWTIGLQLQVPIFVGGRIRGDEMVAQANVAESREQLAQARELAALDAQSTIAELEQAEASWLASAGTAEQATRAYTIAEVRYREGISTQLELSESRVMLEQAMANRANAARSLQVARIRLALLPNLPLGAGQGGGSSRLQQSQQNAQQQLQSTQPAPRAGSAAGFSQASSPGGRNND